MQLIQNQKIRNLIGTIEEYVPHFDCWQKVHVQILGGENIYNLTCLG